ncbi:hypothetical protein PUR49_09245 [Streptomyces sp. BE147]|uniref:inositol monophosphatase family protein n=1 Tax=Streptomyces sp. BE147 TaxID=3002524 RepID=UPI002E7779D8|nr:inositol monophosphatase family protein [Streptomyces sp. BE147]MEE1736688.1 hypothetical protein [Streptomyces sp. BE147]
MTGDHGRRAPEERESGAAARTGSRGAGLVGVLMEAASAVGRAVGALSAADRRLAADGHRDQYAVDVLADRAARAVLTAHGLGVFSEESGTDFPERPLKVVLDPVDGSANCAAGKGPYGPSLCVVDEHGPLAAVVHELRSGAWFSAVRGQGAVHDGRALSGSASPRIGAVAVGDQGSAPCPGAAAVFSGASAHDLCRVAQGAVDAYVDETNTQAVWDYLAASLIITEAGGVIADRSGAALWSPDDLYARHRIAAASSPELWERFAPFI